MNEKAFAVIQMEHQMLRSALDEPDGLSDDVIDQAGAFIQFEKILM